MISNSDSSENRSQVLVNIYFCIYIAYSIATAVALVMIVQVRMSCKYVMTIWTNAFAIVGALIEVFFVVSLVLAVWSLFRGSNGSYYKSFTGIILLILLALVIGFGIPLIEKTPIELIWDAVRYAEAHREFAVNIPSFCEEKDGLGKCIKFHNKMSELAGLQIFAVMITWIVLDIIIIVYRFFFSNSINESHSDYDKV